MTKEQLIREIVSKICPLHGKRAIVNTSTAPQFEITTCCKEFQEFLEMLLKNNAQNGIDGKESSEIITNG